MKRQTRQHGGFTLVECLIASAILAFAVAAISHAFVAGQMNTYEGLHSERAMSLCEAMLDEVMALPYIDPDSDTTPGPDAGETGRDNFDAADDFHGFSQTLTNVADAAGSVYGAPFDKFARDVAAVYNSVTVTGFSAAVDGLSVTITVTDDTNRQWTMSRFISEPAP